MTTACKIHPAELDFPDASTDLSALTGTEATLRLPAKVKGFKLLPQLRELRTLWCFGIDAERLDILQRCESLEALYIDDVRATDLDGLGQISSLRVLSVAGATKVEPLEWVGRLSPLNQFRLEHPPRVRDLSALRFQPGLQALEVSGFIWTRMNVHSFEPVGDLANLRLLCLTNIQAADGSLRALGRLELLERLEIARFYKWQEFALLSATLRGTECPWFAPSRTVAGRCESCHAGLVMLTGKGQPVVCPRCMPDKVQAHADRFEQAVQDALDKK